MAKMAIRHAIVISTGLLWATTITLTLTGYGSDRLHATLLIGALAVGTTLAGLGFVRLTSAIQSVGITVADSLGDAVRQAADEVHAISTKRPRDPAA